MINTFKNFEFFREDIYLFSPTGELIASRERSPRNLDELRKIIPERGTEELRKSLRTFSNISFIVISTSLGPVAIVNSLLQRLGVVMAIIPHSPDVFYEYKAENSLVGGPTGKVMADLAQSERDSVFYKTKTNSEIFSILGDFTACTLSLLGCDFDVSVSGGAESGEANRFDLHLYAMMLSSLALISRKFTDGRGLRLELCACESGTYFKAFLPLREEERYADFIESSDRQARLGAIYGVCSILSRVGAQTVLQIFPWVDAVDDSYVKQILKNRAKKPDGV